MLMPSTWATSSAPWAATCLYSAVAAHGGTEALGVKRIAFADFGAMLTAVKADTSSTGVKEDYIEGLKVFDKDGTGKVPLPEVKNVLVSLGEKLADDEDMIPYMEFIDKLLAATA